MNFSARRTSAVMRRAAPALVLTAGPLLIAGLFLPIFANGPTNQQLHTPTQTTQAVEAPCPLPTSGFIESADQAISLGNCLLQQQQGLVVDSGSTTAVAMTEQEALIRLGLADPNTTTGSQIPVWYLEISGDVGHVQCPSFWRSSPCSGDSVPFENAFFIFEKGGQRGDGFYCSGECARSPFPPIAAVSPTITPKPTPPFQQTFF